MEGREGVGREGEGEYRVIGEGERSRRGGIRVGLSGDGYGRLTESALWQEAWQVANFAQPRTWFFR